MNRWQRNTPNDPNQGTPQSQVSRWIVVCHSVCWSHLLSIDKKAFIRQVREKEGYEYTTAAAAVKIFDRAYQAFPCLESPIVVAGRFETRAPPNLFDVFLA